MEDLVSVTDFGREDAIVVTRTERVGALGGAIGLAVIIFVLLMPWTEPPADRRNAMLNTIGWSLLFGSVWSLARYLIQARSEIASAAERVRRIFESDPAIVPPGPEDATHRVLCALCVTPTRWVGGFLYVTGSGLMFQHHHWHRSNWQVIRGVPSAGPMPLWIGPPSTVILDQYTILYRP